MGYIDNNLVPGERVIFRTKYHWSIVIFPPIALWFILTILIGTSIAPDLMVAVMLGGFLTFLLVIPLFVRYLTSEFGVTNRRVLIKTGWLAHNTLELNLGRIESFQVRETLFGNLLGYSTLILTGSGGTHQSFHAVAKARELRHAVIEFSTQENEYEYIDQPVRRRPAPRQFGEIAEQQMTRARELYKAGKTEQAVGILETLSAQGYEPAQRVLLRMRAH